MEEVKMTPDEQRIDSMLQIFHLEFLDVASGLKTKESWHTNLKILADLIGKVS